MSIDPNAAPTELLPCPFCGSTDIATDGPSYTLFMCNGCGGQTYDQDSHAEAIAAWNRRAPTAMQPDGLEVVAWAYRGPKGGLIALEAWPDHAPEAEPLVHQSKATAHITRLEADLREARMQILASDGQAQEAYEAQTLLEVDVARLTKELDEAQDQLMLSDGALSSMEQNRSALQRHLNDCTVRAETAEAQNKAMRDLVEQAFRDGLAYGSNVSNGQEPGIGDIAWETSKARATLSTIKEGGGKPS